MSQRAKNSTGKISTAACEQSDDDDNDDDNDDDDNNKAPMVIWKSGTISVTSGQNVHE